ncbi:RNA polymerase sigma factor [Mariniblastus fucicola]|uniref:RNA polymerase sigma factor n=1 Tax=Mariniblastus fucicola TaxID=980251 RepID=A0A5B9PR51_9BACT|nr:RNA polymerase sigma factor [Mariniblastus fucicola]
MENQQTQSLEPVIKRLTRGDASAREELVEAMTLRFRATASRLLRQNPRVRRWELTDDVLQRAMLRLYRSLEDVSPQSTAQLFGLCRLHFSRALTDLARKHYGPLGIGANHDTKNGQLDAAVQSRSSISGTHNPKRLVQWTEFHRAIESLDDQQRIVFEMCWYEVMTHAEIAAALECSTKTVQRRFREACLYLRANCELPEGI